MIRRLLSWIYFNLKKRTIKNSYLRELYIKFHEDNPLLWDKFVDLAQSAMSGLVTFSARNISQLKQLFHDLWGGAKKLHQMTVVENELFNSLQLSLQSKGVA